MQTQYRTPIMRQLTDQQVRFAPREKKLEQADRAERLLGEIVASREYSYEYLCFRVTGYRPDAAPRVNLLGEDLQHDLRQFIEDMTDAAELSVAEVGEPVHTVEELSRHFNVSTKTIARWRQQGLVSRRFISGGRKRVGFLQSSVNNFVSQNKERVQRGERFSQLTDADREAIVEQARRMARLGGCPSDITRRIAQQMSRSVETIRYTLKQFDERHPEIAVFPGHSGPLNDSIKEQIYHSYRCGTSVERIARQHCRTKTSIYRVISEMRARRIMELPLDCIYHDSFDRRSAEADILGAMPEAEGPFKRVRVPAGLPPYLAALYEVPLLTREQEQHLFRKMNYLKYRASKLREKLDGQSAKSALMDEIEQMYDEAVRVKNQIVKANLRLVVSIAKRHVTPSENFFELVSDGNMSLIRAAEKFDFSRGNKFSTYASWAIMKNFARTIPVEYKYRDRFRTSQEEMFSATEDDGSNPYLQESAQQRREAQIERILS
ncbi:MAG: RNA polymerase subunit sigma-70, partial [Planctomycetales bacterium]|nr:RNA polymerase subunit sigma-70 [Planctomycetales bacterium]